ncbi:MAG: hypothetical protein FWD97_04835 [Defluviitaleaceae bacterium]|nr:hypothetical protein [Defluviitaleaceae bacterium]
MGQSKAGVGIQENLSLWVIKNSVEDTPQRSFVIMPLAHCCFGLYKVLAISKRSTKIIFSDVDAILKSLHKQLENKKQTRLS